MELPEQTRTDVMPPVERRGAGVRRPQGAAPLGTALAAVFALAIGWTWWRTGGWVVPSADEGASAVPLAGSLLAAALALAATRLLPPRLDTVVPRTVDRPAVARETVVLVLCALAFPLTGFVPGPPEAYALWKVGLLIALPGAYLGWRRRRRGPSLRIGRPRHGVPVSVWALLPAASYVAMTQFGPLAPAVPDGWPDPVTLAVTAVVTALTAGVGEEVFYRYWLQSRLEALAGRWTGILAASLFFALMHVVSHSAGLEPDLAVTTVIASQGVTGLVLGYLWSRYRRLWACILVHVALNGTLVALHLGGLA